MTRKARIEFNGHRVYFYRRKDSGRMVFGYRPEGSTRPKESTCPAEVRSQLEAESYARAYLDELRRTGATPVIMPVDPKQLAKGPTVAELAERWLELRDDDKALAPATKGQDKSNVHTHIAPRLKDPNAADPMLGDLRIEELGSAKLREWVRGLKAKKAASTVRNITNSLTSLLEDSMAEEWVQLPANPMKHPGVRKELPEVKLRSGQDRVYLTRAQAEALLRCDDVPEHRKVRYLVALTSGMRDGELSGLTWADVDLDAKPPRAEINKALALRGDTGFATLGDTKTDNSKRTLPIHPVAVRALRAWKAKGWAQFAGHKPKATDPIFPSPEGTPWRPRSAQLIRDDLETANQPTKVGAVDIDFHACRRSFLTWLTNAGVASDIIDMLAGHAGKSTRARHYTAAELETMAKAVATIELSITSGEVVALPLAVAVGDDTIIDDQQPNDVPATVTIQDDTQKSAEVVCVLPAEVPASRGKLPGRRRLYSMISGAPGASRTRDLRFRKPLLCPLSYEGGTGKMLD